MDTIKRGDFTNLAKYYNSRPAYDPQLILKIISYMGCGIDGIILADVGAGTGKLTKVAAEAGIKKIYAVEPNDAMRGEGVEWTKSFPAITWLKGSGEETGLPGSCVNWVTMASSFHWTDPNKSLPEFSRILKDGGFFTIMWNTRNIEQSEFHLQIENEIKKIVPELIRVSSGNAAHTKDWEEVLVSTGHFKNVRYIETDWQEVMSRERYLNTWRSVNDIQVQAGVERFEKILSMINERSIGMEKIAVPYKMRSWSVQKV